MKQSKRANVAATVAACAASFGAAVLAQGRSAVSLPDGSKSQEGKSQEGAKNQDGRWVLPDGTPTYHIGANNTVDWYAYSGFRRYHDAGGCTQCHGPAGEGSTFAPALIKSLKTMPYSEFKKIVTNGRKKERSVMPAFAGNRNVMCYVDNIYTYLKARSDGVLARGRPPGHDEKPTVANDLERECFGG